jgi:gliding motility-associated protein GldC
MKKTNNQIVLNITLDDHNIPSAIHWTADDGPDAGISHEVKGFLLSLYDAGTGDTLKIDLWTKDFQIHEMNRLVFFTLKSLADTYLRATDNKGLATDLRRFGEYFAEQCKLKEQAGDKN